MGCTRGIGSRIRVLQATPRREFSRQTASQIAVKAGVSEGTARRHLRALTEVGAVVAVRTPGYADRFRYYRP